MITQERFNLLAAYNRWANARLYAAALDLSELSYRLHTGVYFGILLHLFNHQTHHRGQAHACLSILTGGEPPPLDLLAFQRGGAAPNLEKLIASKPADCKKDKMRIMRP